MMNATMRHHAEALERIRGKAVRAEHTRFVLEARYLIEHRMELPAAILDILKKRARTLRRHGYDPELAAIMALDQHVDVRKLLPKVTK